MDRLCVMWHSIYTQNMNIVSQIFCARKHTPSPPVIWSSTWGLAGRVLSSPTPIIVVPLQFIRGKKWGGGVNQPWTCYHPLLLWHCSFRVHALHPITWYGMLWVFDHLSLILYKFILPSHITSSLLDSKMGGGRLVQDKVVIICLTTFFYWCTLCKSTKGCEVKMTDICYGYGKILEIINAWNIEPPGITGTPLIFRINNTAYSIDTIYPWYFILVRVVNYSYQVIIGESPGSFTSFYIKNHIFGVSVHS